MKKHLVRIVGGEYRHTPIPVVDAPGLRPTPDRVRETLYNWLQHLWARDFSQKRVLDLFAGSGALGFEAASRGVAHVRMVENNHAAIAALRSLRAKLHADHVIIEPGNAERVLAGLQGETFDLVLLDPPFGHQHLEKLWSRLPSLLTAQGLVYVESEMAIPPTPLFEIVRQNRTRNVHFHLLRFAAMQKTVNNPRIRSSTD